MVYRVRDACVAAPLFSVCEVRAGFRLVISPYQASAYSRIRCIGFSTSLWDKKFRDKQRAYGWARVWLTAYCLPTKGDRQPSAGN